MKKILEDILLTIGIISLIPVIIFICFELGYYIAAFVCWAHQLIH